MKICRCDPLVASVGGMCCALLGFDRSHGVAREFGVDAVAVVDQRPVGLRVAVLSVRGMPAWRQERRHTCMTERVEEHAADLGEVADNPAEAQQGGPQKESSHPTQ